MLDREDWREFQERRTRDKANGHRFELEFLVQAQVRQEHLTGQPEWDRFLSYLEAHNEVMKKNLDAMKADLCNPALVDQNEIMAMKTSIARHSGMIDMLDAVLAMPKAIMETGEKAREALKLLK